MEEKTVSKDGAIYLGEKEYRMIMVRMILAHKFHNNNEIPTKIVLPAVDEVEGVPIEHEEVTYAVAGGKAEQE